MANVNRYISGERDEILVLVNSSVTVEVGDLMFLDKANNLRNDGSSNADFTAYPVEYFRTSGASVELNKQTLKTYFLGVALDDKDGISNGEDVNLTVATAGKFEYDLKPGRSVDVGNMFSASGTTSASNLINQKIMKTSDTNKALGFFAESKTHANSAEVLIKSSVFGNTI